MTLPVILFLGLRMPTLHADLIIPIFFAIGAGVMSGIGQLSLAFFIVYALFILVSATLSRFQELDSRLLSPLFIPWLWGSAAMIRQWVARRRDKARWAIIMPVILGVLSLLAAQALADRETWEDIKDSGVPGYTDDDWRSSATMEFMRKNTGMRDAQQLYSNAYDALWFLGDIHADLLPHKDSPGEIASLLAKNTFYLVWFDDGLNPDLIDTAFIGRYKKLAGQRSFGDGTVFFFTGR